MKRISVRSPSNIAFIKYWGQRNKELVLPYNDSFSMNLSNCYTELQIEILEDPSIQKLDFKEYQTETFKPMGEAFLKPVHNMYKTIKQVLGTSEDFGFHMYSYNSFPKKAGIASSASFFSALAMGFARAFHAELTEKELSILARLSGSGSASRSIPDGFVWWHAGESSETSFAESIAPPDYWDIVDLVLVLSREEKKVGSQEGHKGAETSPFFLARQEYLKIHAPEMKQAFLKKDFTKFGTMVEHEALSMHHIMMTQHEPLFFWSGKTVLMLQQISAMRQKGLEVYATIDAGENIHLICQKAHEEQVTRHVAAQGIAEEIISNSAARGTTIL